MDRTFKGICVLAFAAMPAIGIAGWLPTEAGTYDYNDEANWDGGNKDGVFSATLTGDQTISFSDDTSLENGLTIAYGGTNTLTFVSDGTGAKTLTLGGGISVDASKNSPTAHVTIGSATADENLVLDLGGAKRTITATATQNDPSKIGHLKLYATLANGSVEYAGKGVIKVYGANTYAGGTTFSNTGYVYLNNSDALGTGLATVAAQSETPRFHGDVSGIAITNDWLLSGSFNFHGPAMTWTGKLTIPAPIDFWCESDGLTIASPAFDDGNGNCAVANFVKYGSKQLRVETPLAIDNTTISVKNGVWNQYGKLTGANLTIVGNAEHLDYSEHFHLYNAENDLGGVIDIGTGNMNVYLDANGVINDVADTDIRISSPAVLVSNAYSINDLLDNVSEDSSGVFALGRDETVDIDLSGHPFLHLGASGSDRTVSGRVIFPESGALIGGGGKPVIFAAENVFVGDREVTLSGSVHITSLNATSGRVRVPSGSTLVLKNANGGMPDAEIVVEAGGSLQFASDVACVDEIQRAKKVTLLAGSLSFSGNKSYVVKHYLPELVLDTMPGAGGTPQLSSSTKDSKQSLLHIGKITRPTFAFLNVETCASSIGTKDLAPDSSVWHVIVDSGVENVGNGTPGTVTAPLVPWIRAGSAKNVYYDSVRGLRFHTSAERQEYKAAYEGVGPLVEGENMFISYSGTVKFTGEEPSISTFCFGSVENQNFVMDGGTLKVTSGTFGCTYNKVNPTVPIDLCGNHGYIMGINNRAPKLLGSVGGTTKGLTIANETSGRGNYIEVSAMGSYSGDVYIHGAIWNQSATFLPGGTDRPGNIYLEGYWRCGNASPTINALFGHGLVELNNSYHQTVTMGADGCDGDFDGEVRRSNGTLTFKKVGAGRQRFGGDCGHNGATTVEAGVLQFDGSVSSSAVTVKSGATLAGSGVFAKLVTLEAGAGLEAGSTNVEYQVMNLNGGLTLRGDATLTVRRRDRLALGEAVVTGALTIPADAKVTVNVEAGDLRQGRYTLLAADSPLSLANFMRGDNCRKLVLSEDGRELQMLAANGINLVLQ